MKTTSVFLCNLLACSTYYRFLKASGISQIQRWKAVLHQHRQKHHSAVEGCWVDRCQCNGLIHLWVIMTIGGIIDVTSSAAWSSETIHQTRSHLWYSDFDLAILVLSWGCEVMLRFCLDIISWGWLLVSEALGKERKVLLYIPHVLVDTIKEAHYLDPPHSWFSPPSTCSPCLTPACLFSSLRAKMACDILAWGVNSGRQDLKNIHE